ncbi:MAG: thioredoxin-disulfide reductase [Endomicrobium sp.]|jgi:thioredoxin reductase (NADPH)|nr:thioredoxin-disulfide reductase [Endomicrobium sp.]
MIIYDIIIVGAGSAGLSAAIYASRAKLKTLLLEKNRCGGHLLIIDLLENYPGFYKGISGFDFAIKLEMQAKEFGTEIIYDDVLCIENKLNVKKVITANSIYESRTVVIATGTSLKKTNVLGESKFIGRGVSFCAVCDAPFYKNKDVLVIGGGDSAVQESIHISKFANSVTIICKNDKLKAIKVLQDRMLIHKNISVIYNAIPKEFYGKELLEKVTIMDVNTQQKKDLKINGVFIFIGLIPNTHFISNLITNEFGYILTDENMNTSVSGFFACGDVRKKQLKQVVTAVSDGVQAAVSAQNYIEENI